MHIKALQWKVTLQQAEELLYGIEKKLHTINSRPGITNVDVTMERLSKSAKKKSEEINRIKQSISYFENRLSLMNECDTSQCDTAFFEEAEAISLQVKKVNKNVNVLSSKIDIIKESKILD
tara:strand:- start:157 stop:519 length:363 start_codon:yes stop_codon:yes gene_type:complete